MYRAYIRDEKQSVRDKTTTANKEVAIAAFSALVDRTDLDGKKLCAVLNRDGQPIAYHRFDVDAGDTNYWRGRIDDLPMEDPTATRKVGRPATVSGDRTNVMMPQRHRDIALRAGTDPDDSEPNLSRGVRTALEFWEKHHPEK